MTMADRVTIGQQWSRHARRAADRMTVTVQQVHRADRCVTARWLNGPQIGRKTAITFADLRTKWRQV